MITQAQYDTHDYTATAHDGCSTCVDWYYQGNSPEPVKCCIKNCLSGQMVDGRYPRQICDKCESRLL